MFTTDAISKDNKFKIPFPTGKFIVEGSKLLTFRRKA